MTEGSKGFFKGISDEMNSSMKIKKNKNGTVTLEYETAFNFTLTFLFICGIVSCGIIIYNQSFGPFFANPMPYILIGLLTVGVKMIQSKSSFETIIDISRSQVFFKKNLLSIVKQSKAVPLSTIKFVAVNGKLSLGRGNLTEYYISMILDSGKIIKLSDSMWERQIDSNIKTAQELSEILKVDLLETQIDKTIVIKSIPVLTKDSLEYKSLKDVSKKYIFVVLAIICFSIVTAFIIGILLN